jgi:hypothetical protein
VLRWGRQVKEGDDVILCLIVFVLKCVQKKKTIGRIVLMRMIETTQSMLIEFFELNFGGRIKRCCWHASSSSDYQIDEKIDHNRQHERRRHTTDWQCVTIEIDIRETQNKNF